MTSQNGAKRGRAAAALQAGVATSMRSRHAVRCWAVCGVLATLPAGALALEFGKLQWRPATKEAPAQVEILLQDAAEIDPAGIRARLGVKESYGVAGLTYLPAFAGVQVKAGKRPDGAVVLRLEGLPADAASLDLLVNVHYKLKMTLAEFRVDLRQGAVEVPPMPAGSLLAGAVPPAPLPLRAPPQAAATAAQPIAAALTGTKAQLASHTMPTPAAAPAAAHAGAAALPAPAPAGATPPALAGAQAALQAWAEAWSRKDVDTYLAAYAPDHAGRGAPNAAAWREQRRARIVARKTIEVQLSALELKPEGSQVVATFTQNYRADSLREKVRKRMVLAQAGGRWLITEESELR